MGVTTKIPWCHHTWNPWRGCAKVSEGCAHCYAERGSKRNPASLGTWGERGRRAIGAEAYWHLPFRWNREAVDAGERRRVFSLSLGDWLEDRPDLDVPRGRLLATIALTPQLDWLLLTKRPERFRPAVRAAKGTGNPVYDVALDFLRENWLAGVPPANVWIGVSAENQPRLNERRDALAAIPASVRFISAEPLLGPISILGSRADWVIMGGESGPDARPCDIAWIRALIAQCRRIGAAPFVKQLGANVEALDIGFIHPGDAFPGGPKLSDGTLGSHIPRVHLVHPKGADPDEWPESLNVREFPR